MRHCRPGCLSGALLVLLLSLPIRVHAAEAEVDHLLKQGREGFYRSVEDEAEIDPSIRTFQALAETDSAYEGRALTYTGALTALKGKHAFWPYQKLKWVKQGLALMDRGIARSPSDPEALFVRGSTCHYLPFFLRRKDDAQRDFRRIIEVLPGRVHAYDPELMANVVRFIAEHADLTDDERRALREIEATLPQR